MVTPHCLAFEASDLHKQLENGLLVVGLVFFGDNASTNGNAKGIAGIQWPSG